LSLLDNDACFQNPRFRFNSKHPTALPRSLKASSLLLIAFVIYYQIICNLVYLYYLHKKKNISSIYLIWSIDYWPEGVDNLLRLAMEPGFDICCWRRFHCKGKVLPRVNNQCRQWFLRRILRINHEAWNGTRKSTGSSSFCMSTNNLPETVFLH
jgi:hypothetical protein